ncbi:MAG: bifunctional 5,10-methylenetetrahydrofolate dehydrogenase/5,10-methenyltetrahydrofolate cyclohydrolase [Oscillospiraceae bacterium]|nr:bifunctional 5,10-methylenetetrahydrofolate dehydrogenase/5,10-methenyltetrahydrofolate cyclohydrolase [Oscillospiraceae bacterium]
MAILMKGAPVAAAINDRTRQDCAYLRSQGVIPTLALVRVGENDADVYYERAAMKRCESVGVETRNIILRESASEEELIAALRDLNEDRTVHGVLLFRPLPKHMDDARVRNTLSPEKDVDGITEASLGGIFTGSGVGYAPCTARSVMEILDYYGAQLEGARAVVLGRSLVVGKPVSQLLMARNATVTVCHRRTRELKEELRRADIIVAAAGSRGSVTIGHVCPGQVIVDVGINTDENGRMVGDVDFEDVEPFVSAITPVPGGVGAVTTSVLASHTVAAAKARWARGL